MKESFDSDSNVKKTQLKFTIANNFSRCFLSLFSIFSRNLTIYNPIKSTRRCR